MEKLVVPKGKPKRDQLVALTKKCREALKKLKSIDSEVRLPLFIEFAGSPKSGKTTAIGIVAHFLRRMKLQVIQPAEGASLRTPPGLRDDWFAFNTWSGCYALQQILVDSASDPPADVVILDRGLFDVASWMSFLCSSEKRITKDDQKAITDFFTSELWCRRQNAVFLFTADHASSMCRENHEKLTSEPGSVMNKDTLAALRTAYKSTGSRLSAEFPNLFHVDTSFKSENHPSFQQIAYVVAEKIVEMIEELSTQMLLVTKPAPFAGFEVEKDVVDQVVAGIINKHNPRFLDRQEAEETTDWQQLVPYAILENEDGNYFFARRRSDASRKELKGKYTILVGGHAEKRDWCDDDPERTFEQCLRRELEEELIGIQILDVKPLGFINDTRSRLGSLHLAFIHRVRVGGRAAIRRQAIDQEFGRDSIKWRSADEIKGEVDRLDPWSQIVAGKLFGASVPDRDLFIANSESPE